MIATSYILLIDDDQITNFVNQTIIEKSEVPIGTKAVITGTDGIDYLLKCLSNHEDLPYAILLDINMPEMNGWEFLEEFSRLDKKIRNEVKVYMVSSSQNEEDVKRALSNPNVTDFLHKPLNSNMVRKVFG